MLTVEQSCSSVVRQGADEIVAPYMIGTLVDPNWTAAGCWSEIDGAVYFAALCATFKFIINNRGAR
jgi:hypothetical protein